MKSFQTLKTIRRACAALLLFALGFPAQAVTWAPENNPASTGLWSETANWSTGILPTIADKVQFSHQQSRVCIINTAAIANQLVLGDNGPGVVVIANGGSLFTGTNWSAVSYNNLARLEVQTGGSAVFNQHLWVGLNSPGDGTVILNGGTITVNGMFGLGTSGGKGTVQVNGGALYLAQWNTNNSISGNSTLDIQAGKVFITNDLTSSVDAYIASGKITSYGGVGTVSRVYDTNANATILTATKTPGAGGPYPATNWPTNINPNKMVHYYVSDATLTAPNANWTNSLDLKDQGIITGDQAISDITELDLLGKLAISNNLNVLDYNYTNWNSVPEIDVLVQVYGNAAVLKTTDGGQCRLIQFLTGTLPSPPAVYGGTFSANAHNLKWNWLLFSITNTLIADGTGTNRQVGTIKTNATGDYTYGGVNGGTIRLQGPDNGVKGLTIHAIAFGEKGAFGTASDINQFAPADGSCPEVLDVNLVGIDFNAGYTNHLQVINDPGSGQTVTFANDIGPAGDKRKAVIPDYYLNFGIISNYLGQACNENTTIKVCVDYYDDPAFAGNSVMFGVESYATDAMGDLAYPSGGLVTLQGTGQWLRQSWIIPGVNLYGVYVAPLTGGPRFISLGGQVAVSRFEMAALRTLGPLAGQDPLADCYPDPMICLGVYGNYAELDLANGITNGLDLGSSSGDQTFVVEPAGPLNDQRLSVRSDSQTSYYLNFQIVTNALGPTTQGNLHLAIVATYYDDPALIGTGFRPQVWKSQSATGANLTYMGADKNMVLQGTGKWRDAYWEIGAISLDGVNQPPQAAARFQSDGGQVHICRLRYAVIRPCGATAGQNLLSNKAALAAAPDTNSLLRVSWPYHAPQAVLQSTHTLGGTWSTFPGTPAIEGGEQSVIRFGPTNGNSQFFRLNLTPQ